eukprot:jgi/Tetstr1/427551/TSEL_017677.t1
MPVHSALAATTYWVVLLVCAALVGASTPLRPPIWEEMLSIADEARLAARSRGEWFLPPVALPKGVSLHEDPFDNCGTALKLARYPRKDLEGLEDFFEDNLMVEKEATDRYELVRVLGKGSQGTVALAKDNLTRDLVAIKKAAVQELAKEIGLLQAVQGSDDMMVLKNVLRLRHPETAGHAFVVYERLAEPIDKVFRLWGEYSRTPKSALTRIMFNIARGLNFLHTNSIVHLDVKPDNVMIAQDCGVRIVDLGQARLMLTPSGKRRNITLGDMRHGMHPPEQCLRARDELVGLHAGLQRAKAADVWSLGLTMLTVLHGGTDPLSHYAQATGQKLNYVYRSVILARMFGRPRTSVLDEYYSRAARRLILGQRISKTPAVPLEKVFPHISTAALQMVSRMMQMDPMARPSTTEILLDPYFKHIRSAPYHKKSLAERLEPDPRIPTLLHLKGLGEAPTRDTAREILYELSLAYSPVTSDAATGRSSL